MTIFLFFTLSVRKDKPLEKYMEWTPNNKVISMVLERKDAQNKFHPKKIDFVGDTKLTLDDLNLTELEVKHAMREGDVEFSNDSTMPRANPKQYFIEVEINDSAYFVVAKVYKGLSEITSLGKIEDN